MHPDGFCCFDGRYICVFAVGIQGRIIRIPKGPIADGLCRLTGIALPLTVLADMIADFRQYFAVDILQRQPAVADHLAGVLQAHGPQAEAVLPIAVQVPFDPIPDVLSIEGVRISGSLFLFW